jgi:uncharacterized protein
VSELTINISRLSEGTHKYVFETDAKSLDLDTRFVGPLEVQAELDKTGGQIHLKVEVGVKASLVCDRCLDGFEQRLSARYSVVYLAQEAGVRSENSEEIQYLSPDVTLLDLGEDVRQFVVLSVPQKVLCKEECLGLCPTCGANKNKTQCKCTEASEDPRWEQLRKISFN